MAHAYFPFGVVVFTKNLSKHFLLQKLEEIPIFCHETL